MMRFRDPGRRAVRPSIHLYCRSYLSRASSRSLASIHNTRPSTAVGDADIARLASQPLHPLTLADLVKHGPPPLSWKALYESANFTLSILPARLAHRIQSLRNLPFIVVTNPHISQIHNNYVHSLSTLLPFAQRRIDTPEDEFKFTEALAGLVKTHANTIPVLARGFLQSKKYVSGAVISQFLNEHLRARIGTRLIAEQHIAHHDASQLFLQSNNSYKTAPASTASGEGAAGAATPSTFIGVIDTALQPASVVRNCESFVSEICELRYGVRPTVLIDGTPETRIAHIPMHLEYIMTELLKNAFRAVIERHHEREPIEVTIAPAPEASLGAGSLAASVQGDTPSSLSASGIPSSASKSAITSPFPSSGPPSAASAAVNSHIKPLENATPGVTIRIRDRGGGIAPENYANIWDFSFTTFDEHESSPGSAASTGSGSGSDSPSSDGLSAISGAVAGHSSIAGLGYGLPLSRAYAEYFGGGIAVQNLDGWGCDVYLSLRGVGKVI